MKFHENMTLASWRKDVHDFKGILLKSPANFAFKTGFVFIEAFINNEIWTVYFFVVVNMSDASKRACRERDL